MVRNTGVVPEMINPSMNCKSVTLRFHFFNRLTIENGFHDGWQVLYGVRCGRLTPFAANATLRAFSPASRII